MADSFSDEEIGAAIDATFRPEIQAPEAQEPTTVGLPQMPSMPEPKVIDEAIDDEFGSLDQRVKTSMVASEKVDPDRRAEALKLSKRFNLPTDFIERNYDSFKAKASKPDLDGLDQASPGVARFLSKPENAALAKDDVDSLRKIEKGYARLKPKQEGAIASATAAGWGQLKMSANSLAVAYGYMSPEEAAEANADIMKTLNDIESTKPDFAKEAEAVLNKESKDISAGMDEVFDAMESWRRGKIKESLVGGAVGTAKTIGEFFDLVGTAATMPKGTGYLILQNAVSSSPGLISGAAGGLYGFGMGGPGGAAVGFLGAGFAGEYAVEVGAWTSNEVSKRVKDNTDPEQLKAIYQDANLMAEIRKQAERKGLGTAGVSMLFNLAGGRLLKRATTLPGKAAAGAGELAIQATGEGVSEATGQIYANEGDFTKVDWNEVGLETVLGLGHQVGELAMSPVRMGAQAAADAARSRLSEERVAEIRSELNADPVRAVEDLSERVKTVDDSLKKAQVIDEVIEVAANSKLGKRLDGKIKELISEIAATDETATVYFQADDFDNFWTKKGLSPVKAASELLGDNGKAYNEAKETGQPIAVPIEQYVEVVSKDQETAHELTNILRTDPAGPSVIEAREINRALPQIFNKLKEEASSQSAVISDTEQEATQIANELAEQAKAAGRPARETKRIRELIKSSFATLAERSGQTPRQLFEKYGLRIAGPEVMAAMPVETVPLEAGESVLEQGGQGIPGPNELGFYSRLERTVMDKVPNSATPEQIRGTLRDIKPEEMKWSGLDEFLKGKDKVSKAELLEFLRANQVEIVEVTKGGEQPQITTEDFNSNYEVADMEVEGLEAVHDYNVPEAFNDVVEYATIEEYSDGKFDLNINGNGQGTFDRMEKAIEAIEQFITVETGTRFSDKVGETDSTKFGQYVLPGGENYREVLFTLPPKTGEGETPGQAAKRLFGKDSFYDLTDEQQQQVMAEQRQQKPVETFTSSHFDEKNILAHVRLDDRVDADGKKVLHVNEIQSDWHQAGRERGYRGDAASDAKKAFDEYSKKLSEKYDIPTGANMAMFATIKKMDSDEVAEYERLQSEWLDSSGRGQVPDAPFKQTDAWVGLALKRIIRMAAENGYDRVTWSKGEQVVKYFPNIAEVLDNIAWRNESEGSKTVVLAPRSGNDILVSVNNKGIVEGGQFAGKTLAEVVGKDAAAQIMNAKESGEMKASDISVSAQAAGMRKFYDDIVVKNANKLVKKFGGKVGETSVETPILGESVDDIKEWRNSIETLKNDRDIIAKNKNNDHTFNETTSDDTFRKYESDKLKKLFIEETLSDGEVFAQYDNKLIKKYDNIDEAMSSIEDDAVKWLDDKIADETKNADDAEANRRGGTKVHSFDITPELREAAINEGFSLFQQGRGRIRFGSDRKFTIELLKNADPSTLLHELGHFYLEVMGDLAQAEGASSQIKDDFNTLLEWFGVSDRSQITTEHHEQLARGFEAYLMEGKAPANAPKGLVKAFYNFKQWLITTYKNIKALNVELNDDVRRVFDRLLVSDQAVSDAAADVMADPLLSDAELAGLSDAQAARYLEMREEARIAAENEVRSKVFKDFELSTAKEYKQRAARFKVEFENQANAMPVFNAIEGLRHNKRADGTHLADLPVKLNLDEIKQVYGEDVASKLPKGLTGKAGLPAEMIAPLFGYESAKQMIDELIATPSKKQWIEDRVKAATEATAPDAGWQLNVVNDAIEAYHNEHRERIMRMEMEFMAQNDFPQFKDMAARLIKRLPRMERAKAEATRIIGQGKVRHVKPDQYVRAQGKYAGVAAKAFKRGDLQSAWDAKYKELLNFYLYREARAQEKQIAKDLEFFKKLKKADKDLAKSRDTDIVNAARAVLSMYGLDRQGKPAVEHLEKIQKYDPVTYETIRALVDSATTDAGPYKETSVEKFNEMSEAVRALWDLSKTSKEVEINGQKIAIETAVSELAAQTEVFKKNKKAKTGLQKTVTDREKWIDGLMGIKSMMRRVEPWVDVMDMGKIDGPFRKYLYQPVSDAIDSFNLSLKGYQDRFLKMSQPIVSSMDLKKSIEAEEIGFEFKNKAELLGAMLHTGNESNKRKLLLGREWASQNEDGSLDTRNWDQFINRMASEGVLTKEDMDYVQSVWDLMAELLPGAQRAHKKLFGFFFKEVQAGSIQTPWGEYKGGYAPAKVDPYAVKDIALRGELEKFIESNPSYLLPHSGGGGFTKSRVEFNKPLALDLGLAPKHIEEVLRFSIVKPAVADAAKVALNQGFASDMAVVDSTAIEKMLKPALNRADKNTMSQSDPSGSPLVRHFGNLLKTNSSMQLMFFNLVNTAEQIGGFGISATRISPRAIMKAGYRFMSQPNKARLEINKKSKFMAARGDDQMFEIQRQSKSIFDDKSMMMKAREYALKHMYVTQAVTQNFVDSVTWSASYDESMSKGLTHDQAVKKADADVRLTQSSMRAFDRSNMESNPTFAFFNMFQNFFNMMLNINATNFTKLYYEDMGLKAKTARGFYLYLMGFSSVAVVSALVRKAAAGALDEDDDREYIDDLYDVFIGSQIDLALAMIPVVGPSINAGLNQINDKHYDDRVSASPAATALTAIAGTTAKLATGKLTDDKGVKHDVGDGLTAIGIMTGLPTGALRRPVGYMIDIDSGKARPTGPIDFTRGILTGKPGAR